MTRKLITVPKNKKVQELLEYDQADVQDLVEWNIDKDSYENLYKSGIFDLFNDELGLLIDDSEDEQITDTTILNDALNITHELMKSSKYQSDLNNLADFLTKAIEFNTGIYFYF